MNVSLEKTKTCASSLQVICDDGSRKTLHSLYDPEAEAKALADAFHFDGKGIIVVLGLGLGYHLLELKKRFPDAEIIVVEGIPEIYEMARKQRFGQQSLEGNIRFIVGRNQDEVEKEIAKTQIVAGMAPIAVFTLSSEVSAFPDYYVPILVSLKKTTFLRLWEKLKYAKFTEDTARVLILDLGYFLTREIESALKGAGDKILRFSVRKGEDGEFVIRRLLKRILDFRPDFILTLNHLGFDEDGALTSFLKAIEMPVASWYVDSPDLIIKAHEKNISPYTSIFLWDKSYLGNMKSMGFEAVEYLPLAADETLFKPLQLKPEDIKKYSADVGFVGNSMVEPTAKWLSRVRPELHPLLERLAKNILQNRRTFAEMLAQISDSDRKIIEGLEAKERMDFEAAVLWKATLLYRLSCIKALQGFDVRVHGDDGWKTLLNGSFRHLSPLNYYRELPLFYNACKLNLNATNLQMSEAVNQRVFDVPACGGFILTDHQEALNELFEADTEIATYKNRDEIPDLARFYLNNPEERKRIALKGRERVLREHTYKERVYTLIRHMMSRYG